MAASALAGKSKHPVDRELAKTLGSTFRLWNKLKTIMAKKFAPVSEEWGYSSQSTGWSLQLKRNKRAILYLTPCQGYFLASFALGEKAVQAAHASGLPTSILTTIDKATKYVEGRGVRLMVKKAKDVRHIEQLAEIKMAN
jgi:uncharacterized protein DUF3788